MQHYVFPSHGSVKIKINFIDFVFGFHLNEKVLMIENSIN